MNHSLRRLAPFLAITLAAGVSGCGGDKLTLPGDATPTSLTLVTGDGQAGIVGTALPLPLVVKVADELGRAVANQNVDFTIVSGGGQVAPGSVTTGSDGRASATWTLGPNAGPQQVRAQATGGAAPDNLVFVFNATAIAGSGSLIAAVSGNDQTAPVNSSLADSLVVKVSDADNNPVEGITIQWTAVGGGSVSPETVVTSADGRAATARVLGATAGQQSAQAAADGLAGSPVTFVHTAVASNPTALTEVSGNGQSAPAGFELAEDLVVKLTDADGNGVGGRAVSWVILTGGGTPNPAISTTDPQGFARTRWTLGSTAGQNALKAVFSGLPEVPFTAMGSSDVPTKIALQSGDNQSAPGGQALPLALGVRVTDANDNPVENVSVNWTANGGGTVSAPTSPTNAQGIAQIGRTLGPTPGQYTTTAAVDGLTGSPVTFTSTATVGAASKVVILQQPGATAAVGALLSPQPIVQVQDAGNNGVGPAGRVVTAQLVNPPAGATLGGDLTQDTDANGQATFTDLRITGPVGSYTIRFRSGALTPAVSDPIAVTVGAPSGSSSFVDANPTSVAIGATSTITVTARDAGGNPVSGVNVVLQATGGGSFVQPGPTDVNGQTTGTFSSSALGAHVISATVNGTAVTDNATVTVTAGPPSASQSTVSASPTSVAVGVSSTITVTARDADNNPIQGATVVLAVTGSNNTITQPSGTTAANGQITGSFSSTTPETKTVTAQINGIDITDNAIVTVTTGPPSATQSQLSANPTTITAGGSGSTITVTAVDAAGNPIQGAIVALSASGGGANVFTPAAPTDANGVTTSTYTGTEAGDHVISATISGVSIDATATVTVEAGSASSLTFTTQPSDTPVNQPIAPAPVVAVDDQFGNPVSGTVGIELVLPLLGSGTLGGTVSVAAVGGNATFSNLSVDTPTLVLPNQLRATLGSIAVLSSEFAVTP